MRPQKPRTIRCSPRQRRFRPSGIPVSRLEVVRLTLDELEAIRFTGVEHLAQIEAAGKMGISRPTFSRILTSAQRKLADALVHVKEIRVEGGCCHRPRRNACRKS
jgi:uncharacterized protein